MQQFVLAAIQAGMVKSAHDVSDGGLAVCLAECCITNPDQLLGCTAALCSDIRPDALWFGEAQSRIVVSLPPVKQTAFEKFAREYSVPIHVLGEVTGERFHIDNICDFDPRQLKDAYYNCLPQLMERTI